MGKRVFECFVFWGEIVDSLKFTQVMSFKSRKIRVVVSHPESVLGFNWEKVTWVCLMSKKEPECVLGRERNLSVSWVEKGAWVCLRSDRIGSYQLASVLRGTCEAKVCVIGCTRRVAYYSGICL